MAKNKERDRTPRQRRRFRARSHVWLERNSSTPTPGREEPYENGFKCHYCELWYRKKHRTKDHVVPKAWGGVNEKWNIVLSCRTCNIEKGSNPPTCGCEFCVASVLKHKEIWEAQGLAA